MIFGDVYSNVISSFGSLWKFKERGATLEVITPFATTNNKFVSIFITKRDANYIVSDGGWIATNEYETDGGESDCLEKILFHYLGSFNIQQTAVNNLPFYYNSTTKEEMVSSLVMDMATFVSAVTSASNITFVEKKEADSRSVFRSSANNYLGGMIAPKNLKFNECLDEGKIVKIDALIKHGSNLTLVNYITGSSPYYLNGSIGKVNMIFEMAEKSSFKDYIRHKYAIVNDVSEGYKTEKVGLLIKHFSEQTGAGILNWTARSTPDFKRKLQLT